MKTEEIKDLFNKFESIVCDYNGWNVGVLESCISSSATYNGAISLP